MLKRLIEVALPLKEVSEESAREKSIRHGHISTLHIWWARRPLAACRASIFASLIPDPDDPHCPEAFRAEVAEVLGKPEFVPKFPDGSLAEDTPRNRCLEFIKRMVTWKNSNKPEYVEPARRLIASAHAILQPESKDQKPRVLDPFSGGGTIPLEALRLGCESHAIDINPVAHLIQRCTLVFPQQYGRPSSRPVPEYIRSLGDRQDSRVEKNGQTSLFKSESAEPGTPTPSVKISEKDYVKNPLLADFKYWGSVVALRAKASVAQYYDGDSASGPAVFLWARTVICPNPSCRREVPLLQTKAVAKRTEDCVSLEIGFSDKRCTFTLVNSKPHDDIDTSGTLKRNSAFCPNCNYVIEKTALETVGTSSGFGERVTCVVDISDSGKVYREPNAEDQERIRAAEQLLADDESENPLRQLIPDEPLPYLRSIFNVHVYGLQNWSQLYNARQRITLATISKCIHEVANEITEHHDEGYAKAITAYLTLTLGRQADYCSSLCTWTPGGEFMTHTFGRQALPMVWDYAEVNPFCNVSGNWEGAIDWISRVIVELSASSEVPAHVQRGDATRTPFEDGSFDCVMTDPPYYDAVPYADLSDYFYVWFRRTLDGVFPDIFATPLSPKASEIVQLAGRNDRYKNKTKEFFEDGMARAFADSQRILNDNGLYIVVFAHKTTAAWETLVGALVNEGLVVTASWPLHTERPGRKRAQKSAALASSVFLVCRKRTGVDSEGLWDDVREELKVVASERLDFFWDQGIRGADFFISAIGPALSVFGRYERVIRLSGEEVSVGEFLDAVRSLVTTYALTKILHTTHTSAIDPESRFYVVWKWSYGDTKVPADESFKLAQALGIETESMWDQSGVLAKSGETVQCLEIAKRMKIKDLGEPESEGTPASLIDVLHRLCAFRVKNDASGMGEFLGRSGHARNSTLWLVAQAVSEILPDGEREKQLMQGLLNQKDSLEEATREGKLF